MSIVLKPCPFCGGTANGHRIYDSRRGGAVCWVRCEKCECSLNAFNSPEPAAKQWNARPNEDKLRAEVVELRACVHYVLRRMFFSRGQQRTIQEFKDFVKKSEES